VQFTGSDGSVFTFTNYFGTNVTGYVNAAGYFSISTNINPYLYAYSQAQSDSKYISTIGFTNTLTLIAGLPASVTNYGSSSNLLLQFSIPQGSNGVAGANGTNGVGINGTNGAPGSTGPAGTNAVNWNFSSDFNVTSTTNVDVTNSPALAGKPGSAYALTTSVPTTNNLATTNGTYPLMMVGNATTAAGGWPTTWSGASITSAVAQSTHATNADNATTASGGWPTTCAASSITSPPWATNTPSGIAAAGGDTNLPSAYQPAAATLSNIVNNLPVSRLSVTAIGGNTNYIPYVTSTNIGAGGNGSYFVITNSTTSPSAFLIQMIVGSQAGMPASPICTVNYGIVFNSVPYPSISYVDASTTPGILAQETDLRLPYDLFTVSNFVIYSTSGALLASTTNAFLIKVSGGN
jgi:hypothetical protein